MSIYPPEIALLRKRYTRHKYQAKVRGIRFSLTFFEWLTIWIASGKLAKRGSRGGGYVMSRPGDKGPYEIGNVKIALHIENVAEGWQDPIKHKLRASKISSSNTGKIYGPRTKEQIEKTAAANRGNESFREAVRQAWVRRRARQKC